MCTANDNTQSFRKCGSKEMHIIFSIFSKELFYPHNRVTRLLGDTNSFAQLLFAYLNFVIILKPEKPKTEELRSSCKCVSYLSPEIKILIEFFSYHI